MHFIRPALLAATVLLPATALARPMTPEDVARLEQVGSIAVAPDGARVAYTVDALPDVLAGEEDGSATSTLRLAYGPDNARTYLPADVDPSSVAFSPDGRTLAFLWAKEDEDRAVWGIPVDGGAQAKLAMVEDADVRRFAYSPDGGTLYLIATAAADTQREDEDEAGFDAIVYEEEPKLNRLFAARVGGEPDAAPRSIAIPGYVTAIDVLPSGREAVIASAPTPNIDDDYTSKRLHVVDLASGTVRTTIETPGKIGDFEIAPDGTTGSLIAAIDMNDPAATTLHTVDLSNGSYSALNAGAPEAAVDAKWLANGELATIVHTGAQSSLRIYNGFDQARTVPAGDLVLTSIEAAGDDIFVTANSPTHPSEVYKLDGNRFVRWTRHNPWLAEIDFGTQRTLTYAARDGQQVEGILIEPVGSVPGGGAPTIMAVHGGPEAHYSNGWLTGYSLPGQVAAGQGYAVFYPNYRGSTGYGVAFAKQHQDDYAGKEFNDIVDAKRFLVSEGITDANRTGITGGSYGGYASAWGATALSAEYAASVMFVGISNQISKFGTTDIPQEMFNVHSRKWPWKDWQGMLEVSPIYHTDKAETPLLIMHGEEDTRVSPSQSYELYRTIKVRKPDTPVRLVLYPGEGHGNRGAASRYDYNLRMMRWFDTYLKTGDRTAPLPNSRPVLALEGGDDASGE